MKLISNFELQRRDDQCLSAMFRQVSQHLVQTQHGTADRRNALATLENISRTRAQRLLMRPAL